MTIHRYVCKTRIAKVEEHHIKQCLSGVGDKAVFCEISDGWWVTTYGPSPQCFHVGDADPGYKVDQEVTIALEIRVLEEKTVNRSPLDVAYIDDVEKRV